MWIYNWVKNDTIIQNYRRAKLLTYNSQIVCNVPPCWKWIKFQEAMNYSDSDLDIKIHTSKSAGKSILNPTKNWLEKNIFSWKFSFTDLPELLVVIINTITVISGFIKPLNLIRSQFINFLLKATLLRHSGQKQTSII